MIQNFDSIIYISIVKLLRHYGVFLDDGINYRHLFNKRPYIFSTIFVKYR